MDDQSQVRLADTHFGTLSDTDIGTLPDSGFGMKADSFGLWPKWVSEKVPKQVSGIVPKR